MSQRNTRIIGGIYRTGQIITAGRVLTTYTAYNRNTNDVVGLYVLELPPTLSPSHIQQLFQPLEQRRLLQSPHVLQIHDWGLDTTCAYIVTDPPRGITLQHVLDTENIDIPRALDLSQQLARGLQAFHKHGIAGLDLRPQLITIDTIGTTDRAQIDDIGLRPLLNILGYISSQQVNDIGYLDPRYAPPEYMYHGPVGPWSDTYQLGLLLFSMITGRLPFVGRNHAETGVMQNTSPVPRMSPYKHNMPPGLQEIVEHMLEKNPAMRFTSATALITALEALQTASYPPKSGTQETRSTPAGEGLTREMPPVRKDTTQHTPPPVHTQVQQAAVATQKDLADETPAYAYLCYSQRGMPTQYIAITQKVVIVGRVDPKRGLNPDIDLSAFDPSMTISRQHARIRFEGTFFYIEDLKSSNKTRLGDVVLTPFKAELLRHGETIRFGSIPLRFEIAGDLSLLAAKER